MNELQKRRVVGKLQKHLGTLRGKTVALLGLAFKPNTDDMREAPSRVIAYRLLAEGAEVRAWDPVARPDDLQGVELCDTVLDAVRNADAAVIVTEWPELRSLASPEVREAMARPVIVDGRNLLDPEAAHAAGFVYEASAGRATPRRPSRPACRARRGAPPLMEALLLAGGKAERLGEAAQGLPKPLVPVAGHPLAEYTVGRLVDAGVTRIIVACRAGPGGGLRRRARRLRRRDRRRSASPSRSAAAAASGSRPRSGRRTATVLALNGDELLDVDFRALFDDARGLRRGRDDRRRAGVLAVRRRRPARGRLDHRLQGGAEAAALGELRRLRARRGGARAAARAGRPRAEHVSRAGRRGEAARATGTTASGSP